DLQSTLISFVSGIAAARHYTGYLPDAGSTDRRICALTQIMPLLLKMTQEAPISRESGSVGNCRVSLQHSFPIVALCMESQASVTPFRPPPHSKRQTRPPPPTSQPNQPNPRHRHYGRHHALTAP